MTATSGHQVEVGRPTRAHTQSLGPRRELVRSPRGPDRRDFASIRFLRGLQSLGGTSVCYRDAWGNTHPREPGHTLTTRNPLVMEDSEVRQEQSRRIDYIFVRCTERGPTLEIKSSKLVFDEPVDRVWAGEHFGVVADFAVPD